MPEPENSEKIELFHSRQAELFHLQRRPFPEAVRYALKLPAKTEDVEVLIELVMLQARAAVAEHELPIVDAATAFVEHAAEGPWKATTHEAAVWDKRYLELIAVLAEKVEEARGQ